MSTTNTNALGDTPPTVCPVCTGPCTLPGEGPTGQLGGLCTVCGWDYLVAADDADEHQAPDPLPGDARMHSRRITTNTNTVTPCPSWCIDHLIESKGVERCQGERVVPAGRAGQSARITFNVDRYATTACQARYTGVQIEVGALDADGARALAHELLAVANMLSSDTDGVTEAVTR